MYPSSLLLLLASSVLAAQPALAEAGSQKPLGAFPDAKTPRPAGAAPIPSWHAARLNYSSPGPHLFASTYGLLQQWSNTVFPNGHTMAAVEIPAFTLFYHGRMDEEGPPSPEWLAFDIEMAYGIMGSTRQSFMLTYQTTRPVKALYFDGESATLMGLGQLDTQMLHLYGNVSGPGRGDGRWRGLEPEYERAMGLCDWLLERRLRGDGWGIEGVVRMNAGFEMIWCNFAGGSLRLVSKTNVTAPQTRKISGKSGGGSGGGDEEVPERSEPDRETAPTSAYPLPAQPTLTDRPVSPSRPPMPPNWRGIMGPVDREPFLQSQGWGWFSAATWHYGSNGDGAGQGETRARVLSCGIASWYSKDAWGSIVGEEKERLNLTGEGYWVGGQGGGGGGDDDDDRAVAMNELGRRRRLHHLEGATAAQAAGMRSETEVMLREAVAGGGGCSGMDWVRTMGEIVQRTAGQLTALEQGARFGGDWGNGTAVEEWLYRVRGQSHRFLVSFLEYPHEVDAGTWDTAGAVFGETYSLCRYRYTRLLVGVPLSTRERELRDAAEEVMGSICGVLLEVGFGIEGAWYDLEEGRRSGLEAKAAGWADAVRRLRAWVGWEGEFIRCGRVCGWDERCYIPMWPLVKSVWGGGGGRRPRPAPEYGPGGSRGGDHTGPGGGIPGRGRWWMGDETDLWEPKCVKMENVMPRRRDE